MTTLAAAAASRRVVPALPFDFPLVGELEAKAVVLIVIDLQRDFTEEGGYVSSLGYDIAPLAAPLPRVRAVLEAARRHGVAVVHTRQGFRPDLADLSEYEAAKLRLAGAVVGAPGPLGRVFVRGEPGWELNPAVAPAPGEFVMDKTANSCFVGTDLGKILAAHGAKAGADVKLVVCGNTLDCCVHSTLRSAADLGFQTLLLEDCCGCVSDEDAGCRGLREAMIASVKMEGGLFGAVCTADVFIAALDETCAAAGPGP